MIKKEKKEGLVFFIIISLVFILGISSLVVARKLSINNKYICSYLGGLWVKKDTDPVHRCYTYDEFYK